MIYNFDDQKSYRFPDRRGDASSAVSPPLDSCCHSSTAHFPLDRAVAKSLSTQQRRRASHTCEQAALLRSHTAMPLAE